MTSKIWSNLIGAIGQRSAAKSTDGDAYFADPNWEMRNSRPEVSIQVHLRVEGRNDYAPDSDFPLLS